MASPHGPRSSAPSQRKRNAYPDRSLVAACALAATRSLVAVNKEQCQLGSRGAEKMACPQSLDAVASASFGLEAALDAKVKAGLSGALYLQQAAAKIEASVAMACASIASDLGADISKLAPYDGTGKASEQACSLAASEISKVKASYKASIAVESRPPVCEASLEASAKCTAECDASVDPGSVKATCEGGELRGSCEAECKGNARSRATSSARGNVPAAAPASAKRASAELAAVSAKAPATARSSKASARGPVMGRVLPRHKAAVPAAAKASVKARVRPTLPENAAVNAAANAPSR